MSNSIIDEVVEANELPVTPEPRGEPVTVITPEQIAYAKDVIAGRVIPEPLTCPEMVERMRLDFPDESFQPTPEAVRHQVDHAAIFKIGGGSLVAYTETAGGYLAVLAVGAPAIFHLMDELTPEELPKMTVTDTVEVW